MASVAQSSRHGNRDGDWDWDWDWDGARARGWNAVEAGIRVSRRESV